MNVKEFGKYLKEMRKNASISTHKLAEISGVSQSYISHLENGRKSKAPSPEILKKLADAYKCPYIHLLAKAGYLNSTELNILITKAEWADYYSIKTAKLNEFLQVRVPGRAGDNVIDIAMDYIRYPEKEINIKN